MSVIVAVVGPTATGKSDLALDLAERLTGEVVNADALQFYRGMDIGTAKLPVAERRGIPHHQLDVLDPDQDATVATYQAAARADVAAIEQRGHRPVVVGGSGLYLRALLDRIDFPGTDPQVRAVLEERAEREGTRAVYTELLAADPVAAESIGPRNTRRIVRALEVIALTGAPYSANLPGHEYHRPAVQIGLDCDRGELDRRIELRVARMWQAGLVEEVRDLLARGGIGRTAARAVGYAEVLAALRGEITLEEAREQIVAGTRRLARKQMGWFGRDPRVHWLDARDPSLAEAAMDLVTAADAGTLGLATADPAPRRSLGS